MHDSSPAPQISRDNKNKKNDNKNYDGVVSMSDMLTLTDLYAFTSLIPTYSPLLSPDFLHQPNVTTVFLDVFSCDSQQN